MKTSISLLLLLSLMFQSSISLAHFNGKTLESSESCSMLDQLKCTDDLQLPLWDQNGRCSCLYQNEFLDAEEFCHNAGLKCNEAEGETYSRLFFHYIDDNNQVKNSLVGCGCYKTTPQQ